MTTEMDQPRFLMHQTAPLYIAPPLMLGIFNFRPWSTVSCTYKLPFPGYQHDVVLSASLNTCGITDFCGGAQVTSFRLSLYRLNHADDTFFGDQTHEVRNSILSFYDLFGSEWEEALRRWANIPNPLFAAHWNRGWGGWDLYSRVASPDSNDESILVRGALHCLTASTFAGMMCYNGTYNRNILTFWDKRRGWTRRMLTWAAETFAVGADTGMFVGSEPDNDRLRERWSTRSGLFDTDYSLEIKMPRRVVSTRRITQGRFTVNANSGNAVSAGTLWTATGRAPLAAGPALGVTIDSSTNNDEYVSLNDTFHRHVVASRFRTQLMGLSFSM